MRIIAFTFLFVLTACGFKPLYQAGETTTHMQTELANVQIAPIPDRLGQIMRNNLLDRLNASGSGYRLEVVLEQSSEGFGTRPDSASTQEQLTMVAHVRLISQKTGDDEILLEDNLRARTSYDLVLSDFAIVTQREDSARRLVLELSERIHRRLALYFSKS